MPDPTPPPVFDVEHYNDTVARLNTTSSQAEPPHHDTSVIKDVGIQAVLGPLAGLSETANAVVGPLMKWLNGYDSLPEQQEDGSVIFRETDDISHGFRAPETTMGGLVRGGTQAVTGFMVPGGAAAKVLRLGKAPMMIKGLLQGGVGDFFAFGPHEERLSNVLATLPIPVVSTIADHLKADENDGQFVGRLKNAVEGAGLGLAFEGLFKGVAKLRRAKEIAPTNPKLAADLMKEGNQEVADASAKGNAANGVVLASAAPSPGILKEVEAAAKGEAPRIKDTLINRIKEADPSLSHDEADALATVQGALARYVNPAQAENVTLDSLFKYETGGVAPKAGVKGATEFLDDGKAIIKLFDGADLSTHLHETAHVFSKYLRAEDEAVVRSWLGDAWKTNTKGMEKFARGFERYMREGKAPESFLEAPFARIKQTMQAIYTKIRGTSIGLRLSDDVRGVYDRMLSAEERQAIREVQIKKGVAEVEATTGIKLTPDEGRALADALHHGKPLEPQTLDHLTPKLLAAHQQGGTADLAQAIAAKVNEVNPTGVQTLDTTARLAQELGTNTDAIVSKMKEFVTNDKELPQVVAAFDWHVQAVHQDVKALAAEVAKGNASLDLLSKFVQQSKALQDLVGLQFHSQTILGRSVGAYRLRSDSAASLKMLFEGGPKELFQDVEAAVNAIGGKASIEKVAKQIAAGGTASQTAATASKLTTAMNKTVEWYINAILSGPKTHLVNVASNLLNTVVLPLERAIGGKLVGILTKDKAALAEAQKGIHQLMGLSAAVQESLSAAKRVWEGGPGFLDEAAKIETQGIRNKFVRKYFLVASRALSTEDEFFKQLNFRAAAYAESFAAAAKEADPHKWMQGRIDALVKDPSQFTAGLDVAKVATFTDELPRGSVFWSIQQMVNRNPWMKFIVPFVKTPANIMRQVGVHVPVLPLIREDMRNALMGRAGSTAQAMMVGRQLVGMGAVFGVGSLYAIGAITGAAPVDAQERGNWLAAGNREYSIKVGNTWIEYKRMDPWAPLLGAMTDTMRACAAIKQPDEALKIIWKGVVQGSTDKTYLKGFSDLASAVQDPNKAQSFLSRTAAGFLPYSSALSQLTKQINARAYRMESLVAQLQARSLGLWEPFSPRDIHGAKVDVGYDEGISPLAGTTDINDAVLHELAKVPGGLELRPSPSLGNVKLTPKQHDRLWELQGTSRLNGKTLHEALTALVESPGYQRLPRLEDTPRGYEKFAPRTVLLGRIINHYQEYSKTALSREAPELNANMRQDRANRLGTKAGNFEAILEIAN